MRKAYLLVLFAPAALVWACGGSGDDNLTGDGGNDATTNDGNTQNDSATNDGATNSDSSTNDAGANDASSDVANDVKLDITCLNPSECDGGDVCCGKLTVSGTQQNCKIASAQTQCATANTCATNVGASLQCSGTDTVRLCSSNTDCTEQAYNQCCTFKQGDAGVSFCLNQEFASQAGGTCQ